jgi:hypothetical protein
VRTLVRSPWLLVGIGAVLAAVLAAWSWLGRGDRHVDGDYGFSVACPSGWMVRTTDEGEGRRRVVLEPPREPSAASARCVLLVERTAREAGITQARLNELITARPMTALAWRSLLDEPESSRIVEAGTSTLLGNPASFALVEGTTLRGDRVFHVRERRWVTHTPRSTWEFVCRAERPPDAAQPGTRDDVAIDRIVESLQPLPGVDR